MLPNSSLGDLLTTLLDRRVFRRRNDDGRDIGKICSDLLSETAEVAGRRLLFSVAINGRMTIRKTWRVLPPNFCWM